MARVPVKVRRGPSHADLVASAVRWLRGTRRCGVVFAEICTSLPVIPDAIGWHGRRSIYVECKVSRGDFLADAGKFVRRFPDARSAPGQERWYLVPLGLVRPEEVPSGWGLAEVDAGGRVRIVSAAARTSWSDARAIAELTILLSALRRHAVGAVWISDEARFESLRERHARTGR